MCRAGGTAESEDLKDCNDVSLQSLLSFRSLAHHIQRPPFGLSTCPVTNPASSETR